MTQDRRAATYTYVLQPDMFSVQSLNMRTDVKYLFVVCSYQRRSAHKTDNISSVIGNESSPSVSSSMRNETETRQASPKQYQQWGTSIRHSPKNDEELYAIPPQKFLSKNFVCSTSSPIFEDPLEHN
jgi:hypothetical protein